MFDNKIEHTLIDHQFIEKIQIENNKTFEFNSVNIGHTQK